MGSLIAFEAAARLGSMTAAAAEERTTQPAISQRIRALEEQLGVPLFDRKGGRLTLTARGEHFYDEIAPSLEHILKSCERLKRDGNQPTPSITIAAGSGFTHLRLLPRLPALKQAFPGYTFELTPVDRPDAPELQAADISIRFGTFIPKDQGRLMASEVVFPVCSANYARQHNLTGTLTSADMTRISLLHQDIRDPRWLDWLQWSRLAELVMAPRKDLYMYNNYALLLNAALAHQGVALGWSILVQDYLDSGQLVALGPRVARHDYGYWLSLKHYRSAVVDPIGNWLLEAVPPSP